MTEKIGGNRNGVILKHEQEKVTVRADTVGSVRVYHHSLVFIDEIGSDDDEFLVIFFLVVTCSYYWTCFDSPSTEMIMTLILMMMLMTATQITGRNT